MSEWAGVSPEEYADMQVRAAAHDLLASCKELREVLAAGMRVMALRSTPGSVLTAWLAEVERLGIPNGFGVRAEAAISKAEGK